MLVLAALPAQAQTAVKQQRGWFSVSGGVQIASNGFSDAFDLPLYTEQEHVTVDYPVKNGQVITASGGYRVWRKLSLGLGYSGYTQSGDATVKASLPHPFFDKTFRNIEGTTRARRTEHGAHLLIGFMLPLSDRMRLLLTAGPSIVSVGQTFVSSVRFSETFPYDTAEFTGTDAKNESSTAAGFNAGADFFWMLSRSVGLGGLAQVTHARTRLDAGNGRRVSVDAGGAQIAAGLRVLF